MRRWSGIEYIYASLLLHAAKRPITEDSLRRILEAAGIAVDEIRLKATVAALSQINIDEAIRSAAAMPVAAAPAVTTAAQPSAPQPQPESKPKEEAVEEEKREISEEELAAGLSALFG